MNIFGILFLVCGLLILIWPKLLLYIIGIIFLLLGILVLSTKHLLKKNTDKKANSVGDEKPYIKVGEYKIYKD